MSKEIENQEEEIKEQELEVSQEVEEQEEIVEDSTESEIEIDGVEVDLNHEAGQASGIKEAVAEGIEIRKEERGISSVITNPKVEEKSNDKGQVIVRKKSRHKENVSAFFAQQARKKKLAEIEAKK